MADGPDSHPPAWPSSVVDINLDQLDGRLHHGVDLVGYRLTGQARLVHDVSSHNFISCVFDGVYAADIDLTRCDFKDVLVKDSHFRRCPIQASTHSTCVYVKSLFEECDFSNAAQTNCEFHEVRFERCQLSNLLTKSSRFTDCVFSECASKTHVFEGNVFLRTHFSSTDLEVRAILSNFGLKHTLTENCRIRTTRVSESYAIIDLSELRRIGTERLDNPLALLSVLYFLEGNLLSGGKEVDSAFDFASWMRLAPFSYFCTCWNVRPRSWARALCDMPRAFRSIRMRWPTSTSMESGAFFAMAISSADRVSALGRCFERRTRPLAGYSRHARNCPPLEAVLE